MTEKQETVMRYLITDFADYLGKVANHPYNTIDGRYLIQGKALTAPVVISMLTRPLLHRDKPSKSFRH